MKIRAGIVGYGNLGKALEKQIVKNKNYKLVGVFSRRLVKGTIPYSKIESYADKIDLLFLCVGSQSDLQNIELDLVKNFNIVDCYDNHNKLTGYLKKLNTYAVSNDKIVISSVGWDPGILSLVRALCAVLGYKPFTFWGKGLSQGHTQAIKNIPGVLDAVQFTIPNNKISKKIKYGVQKGVNTYKLHNRLCYVVCDKKRQQLVKNRIVNMPDYFKDYKTIVKFVSQNRLNTLKTFAHKGEIITSGDVINFGLNIKSNPEFTANVMLVYGLSFEQLIKNEKSGVFTIFDIPLKYINKDVNGLL